jgi:integral membrane protein
MIDLLLGLMCNTIQLINVINSQRQNSNKFPDSGRQVVLSLLQNSFMPSLSTLMGQLRLVAFLEGLSLVLLLFVAMPLKYMLDMPAMVRFVGMGHGLLFVAYVIYVLLAKSEFKWSVGKTLLAIFLSVVPFGTFWADWKLFR